MKGITSNPFSDEQPVLAAHDFVFARRRGRSIEIVGQQNAHRHSVAGRHVIHMSVPSPMRLQISARELSQGAANLHADFQAGWTYANEPWQAGDSLDNSLLGVRIWADGLEHLVDTSLAAIQGRESRAALSYLPARIRIR